MKLFKSRGVIIVSVLLAFSSVDAKSQPAVTKAQVCKAAISSIMGVEFDMIKTTDKKDGSIYLYYQIEGKKTKYDYKCKLEGDKIIWGTAMARWRTQKDDAVISYTVENDHLTIKEKFRDEPESEAIKTSFPVAQL